MMEKLEKKNFDKKFKKKTKILHKNKHGISTKNKQFKEFPQFDW